MFNAFDSNKDISSDCDEGEVKVNLPILNIDSNNEPLKRLSHQITF